MTHTDRLNVIKLKSVMNFIELHREIFPDLPHRISFSTTWWILTLNQSLSVLCRGKTSDRAAMGTSHLLYNPSSVLTWTGPGSATTRAWWSRWTSQRGYTAGVGLHLHPAVWAQKSGRLLIEKEAPVKSWAYEAATGPVDEVRICPPSEL